MQMQPYASMANEGKYGMDVMSGPLPYWSIEENKKTSGACDALQIKKLKNSCQSANAEVGVRRAQGLTLMIHSEQYNQVTKVIRVTA